MKLKSKHIWLLSGMALAIFSFLFFGLSSKTYNALLLIGLVVSLLAYFTILFSSGTAKEKLVWSFIVLLSMAVQRLSEGPLINLSYFILVSRYETELSHVNQILSIKSVAYWSRDSSTWHHNGISSEEGFKIRELTKNTGIIRIAKKTGSIFFCTYGMPDVQQGVTYYFDGYEPHDKNGHIKGKWYH